MEFTTALYSRKSARRHRKSALKNCKDGLNLTKQPLLLEPKILDGTEEHASPKFMSTYNRKQGKRGKHRKQASFAPDYYSGSRHPLPKEPEVDVFLLADCKLGVSVSEHASKPSYTVTAKAVHATIPERFSVVETFHDLKIARASRSLQAVGAADNTIVEERQPFGYLSRPTPDAQTIGQLGPRPIIEERRPKWASRYAILEERRPMQHAYRPVLEERRPFAQPYTTGFKVAPREARSIFEWSFEDEQSRSKQHRSSSKRRAL